MARRPLLLEARHVRAGYGRLVALDDVNFGVAEGRFAAVVGPNGTGKSTLLAVLSATLAPWCGEVRLDGRSLRGRAPWDVAAAGVVLVPEGGGVFGGLTVADNLRLAELAAGATGGRDEVLDLFPVLGRRGSQLAATLSGGEKRMLALARALLGSPRVLLVDEPSLGLAPAVVDEVFTLLGRLNREREVTVVVVEQYTRKALAMAHDAWVLVKGRVVYAGPADEVEGAGVLDAAYFGAEAARGA